MKALIAVAALVMLLAGCLGGAGPTDPEAGSERRATAHLFNPDIERPVDAALGLRGRWHVVKVDEPAIHATMLADGRILIFAGLHAHGAVGAPVAAAPHDAETRVYDMLTSPPAKTIPSPSDGGPEGKPHDLFCSDQTLLPDGRVVAFGGTIWRQPPDPIFVGTQDVRIYDPASNTWTSGPNMKFARWYPSTLILPDGKALVAAGISNGNDAQSMVEDLELFDPVTNVTSVLPASAKRDLPMYPRLYVVPSGPLKGRVFFQPAGCLWCPAGNSDGEQGWNYAASFDPATNQWSQHSLAALGVRNAPVSVLLPLKPPNYDAKILTATGTLNRGEVAVPFSEITDLSKNPPTHTLGTQMQHGRWFANHVLLPDGSVVVVGGAKNDGVTILGSDANPVSPVRETEVFVPGPEPTRGVWRTLAPMSIDRIYHSTALLLPDATVWVAGSVPAVAYTPASPPRQDAVEIFEPPYLFRGPRPVVEEAPAAVNWGESFAIKTPDAATVTPILIRTGSVTHVYNPEQRSIELVVEKRESGVLTVQAPPDAALAPPGYYMLFLLKPTDNGPVPSVAPILKLG